MVAGVDHDCYKASFVPPQCRDEVQPRTCCPLPRFAPRAVRDKHVGTGRSPPRLVTHSGSSHLTAPAQPETSPELADIGHFKTTSPQPQEKAGWGLHLPGKCLC